MLKVNETTNAVMPATRAEHDSMGEVQVPRERYWGAQTERSRINFKIGTESSMPTELIQAFGFLKKAAAFANKDLNVLPEDKKDLIARVCDEIIDGQLFDEFPLVIWQTGSGTQSNMNANEVIANRYMYYKVMSLEWANCKSIQMTMSTSPNLQTTLFQLPCILQHIKYCRS